MRKPGADAVPVDLPRLTMRVEGTAVVGPDGIIDRAIFHCVIFGPPGAGVACEFKVVRQKPCTAPEPSE